MLKKVDRKLEVLEIDGTKIHALKPNKASWDRYADAIFSKEKGTINKSSAGWEVLYRECIRKIENVEVEKDGVMVPVAEITAPDEIVSFVLGLTDLEAGRKIDMWLLGLGDLVKEEVKN